MAVTPIKKGFEFFFERLLKGFRSVKNREPDNLEMILIKQEASQKAKDANKVIKVDFDKGRWNKAGGGRTGLSYLLAEDSNERVPYQDGLKVYPQASVKIGEGGLGNDFNLGTKDVTYGGTLMGEKDGLYGGVEGLKIKNKIDFMKENETLFKDTTDDEKINFILGKKGDNYDIRFKTDKDLENKYLTWNWKFNKGGRAGFAGGGMGRRAFLKLMAALGLTGAAAKYGVAGLLKGGAKKKVIKELTEVPIKNIKGMPLWFKPLVNKVIKEGKKLDVTEYDRLVTHKSKLPNSKTDIYVNQDLNTGDVWVDIGQGKHGWVDGYHGQPTRLEYKAKEMIEPDMSKSGKIESKGKAVPEEFNIEEAEFTGGHPENIKFEDVSIEKYGNHGSDFTEVEKYATGKTSKTSKAQKEVWEADWDDSLPDYEEYASGGIARLLGE